MLANVAVGSDAVVRSRAMGVLWSILIADSISMPVHWFYNPNDIKRQFKYIDTYLDAPEYHPSSIMNLHSTGAGGRGGQSASIVGDVILKGKKHLWGTPDRHYHHGMKAGENTLNALCSRVLMRSVSKNSGKYSADVFLQDYIDFMTTPNSHNDTYAESYHRDFFNNWSKGKPPKSCAGVSHDTPSVGGLVTIPVVVLASYKEGRATVKKNVREHLFLTHPDENLASYAAVYADLLCDLLEGKPPKTQILEAAKKVKINLLGYMSYNDDATVVNSNGLACYITSSFPNVLYLAYKYSDEYEKGILQNTNLGGENCHGGSVLGSILGAAVGYENIPKRLIDGLKEKDTIHQEITQFLDTVGL